MLHEAVGTANLANEPINCAKGESPARILEPQMVFQQTHPCRILICRRDDPYVHDPTDFEI